MKKAKLILSPLTPLLQTSFLLTTAQQWQKQSYKVISAQKMNIPIVDVSYIPSCIKKKKLLPTYLFAPVPPPLPSILQSSSSSSSDSSQTPFGYSFHFILFFINLN